MSEYFLSNIEDVFDVTGRGIILAPGFAVSEFAFAGEYEALIKDKCGISKSCKVKFEVPFQSPPPKEVVYLCHVYGISKSEISIGSELWLVNVGNDDIYKNSK